jgi:hypothetical protein
MNRKLQPGIVAALLVVALLARPSMAQDQPTKVAVNWDKVIRVSQTTPTLQVVVNPPLQRGTPVHHNAFKSLHDLQADHVRYVSWLPYPKLGVAELEPPKDGKTSWDFSAIDPITIDFLEATKGHSAILNFSTIPQWMYKSDKPWTYPADPNQVTWDYEKGTELRDPSMQEVADYYARLLAWYTSGGFTDEFGKHHESGYHYPISHWEVLNEVEFEHHIDPETYTRLYDAVVTAMKKVQPDMKFVGLALAMTTDPHYFRIFPRPQEPQARRSPGFHFLPLLCDPVARRNSRGATVHILRPDRGFSEDGALRGIDSQAAVPGNQNDDRRTRRDLG